jgi:hypothetical protein
MSDWSKPIERYVALKHWFGSGVCVDSASMVDLHCVLAVGWLQRLRCACSRSCSLDPFQASKHSTSVPHQSAALQPDERGSVRTISVECSKCKLQYQLCQDRRSESRALCAEASTTRYRANDNAPIVWRRHRCSVRTAVCQVRG